MIEVGDILANNQGRRVGMVTDTLPSGGAVVRYFDPVAEGLVPPYNTDVLAASAIKALKVVDRNYAKWEAEQDRLARIGATRAKDAAAAPSPSMVEDRELATDIVKQLSLFG